MPQRLATLITPIVLLVLLITSSCAGHATEEITSITKQVPKGTNSLVFFDVESVRATDEQVYESWADEFLLYTALLGVNPHDVDGFAVINDNVLIQGDFDLDELRDWLNYADSDTDVDSELFQGIEIWADYGSMEIALMKDIIIYGNGNYVSDCVNVIQGKVPSLYDDKDIGDVVEMRPRGASFVINRQSSFNGLEYDGLIVSVQFFDHKTMKCVGINRFEDERDAKNAIKGIEEEVMKMGEDGWRAIEVTLDTKLVIVTAEATVPGWAQQADPITVPNP